MSKKSLKERKTVLFRSIALIFSFVKPCYLENCVVREPCKRRTACRKFKIRENMRWVRRTSSDFFRDRMAKTHSMLLSSWIILKRSSLMYLSFPTDIRLTSSWRTHETWNKQNGFFKSFVQVCIKIKSQRSVYH